MDPVLKSVAAILALAALYGRQDGCRYTCKAKLNTYADVIAGAEGVEC
jgi:hypothetical protein